VFSGIAGSGIVIARLPDGSWSAPSCIATGGIGWGLQIGADITDFVIVLNSEDAVRALSLGGNVTIGGNIAASAGPIGTGGSLQASLAHPSPMFSYSKSRGVFHSPVHANALRCLSSDRFLRSLCWCIIRRHGPNRTEGR
jgi:lipid-binding SYLF domain-containing protein